MRPRRRITLVVKRCLGLLAACLVVSACGSSARVVSSRPFVLAHRIPPPPPTALRFSAASNRAFARRDVEKLIRIVVLPASARRVPQVPASAPAWFRQELSGSFPGVEAAHRTWVVDSPLKDVVRYFRTHARARPRPEVAFRKPATNRIGSRPHDDWQFHPVPGRSSNRWLNVAMLALPSGRTVVTAQAGDEWIHPPPRSAEIPGTVRRIDITSRYEKDAPRVRLHVRSRYLVGAIVSWMNGLGVIYPRNVFCLGEHIGEPTITLTFRDVQGTAVARGVLPGDGRYGPCNPFALTVNGKRTPRLAIGDLLRRIEQRLNADFSPPVPGDVSSCLRSRGWQVRAVTRGLDVQKNDRQSSITFPPTGKAAITGPRDPAISRCLRSSPHIGYLG